MKRKFREPKLSKANRDRLVTINSIIEEYQSEGYVLTLRQLYYQLVSRDIIPNKDSEYSKLSTLLKEGRMGGIVDWGAIEDRLRVPSKPPSWDSPAEIIDACIKSYARDRQDGQPVYLEVWVEKDALSGVLKRVTEKYHINIMVNRGYSSASAMHDAFLRFVHNAAYENKPAKILYLGDFDPSGLDMIRDIRDRIEEFQEGYGDGSLVEEMKFSVVPIALTTDQIAEYQPPPNPAKITDPRSDWFIHKYGATSWEVDALPPQALNSILEEAITDEMDMEEYQGMLKLEENEKWTLREIKENLESDE
jgi:hypothetical protein